MNNRTIAIVAKILIISLEILLAWIFAKQDIFGKMTSFLLYGIAAIGIFRAIDSIYFSVILNSLANDLFNEMEQLDYPNPALYGYVISKNESWYGQRFFEAISNDTKLPCEIRISATKVATKIEFSEATDLALRNRQMKMALKALEKYQNKFETHS